MTTDKYTNIGASARRRKIEEGEAEKDEKN